MAPTIGLIGACSAWLDIRDPRGHVPDASIVDAGSMESEVDSYAEDGSGAKAGATEIMESDLRDAQVADEDAGDANANKIFMDSPNDTGTPDADAPEGAPPDTPQDGGCPSSLLSWSPGTLQGLVVWLDASKGLDAAAGSPVSLWPDQSPAHNDAVQTLGAMYEPCSS